MENLIEIKNIFVEYQTNKSFLGKQKPVYAVNNLSLDIQKGEIFAIAGESGCGKSTLGKAILRLVDTKSGEINLIYENLKKNILNIENKELKLFRKVAQIIFQNPYSSLNPKMKIYDILKEPLVIHKKKYSEKQIKHTILKTIKKVGLDENSLYNYPHEFSGGQRQRIAIAKALMLKPKFIIADEPVSALDVSIQAQIINLLKELKEKENITFLFISHDLSVIKYLADRVGIMYLGEIVELGTSDEIFNNPKHPYTQALLSAAPGFKDKEEKIILEGDLPSPTELPTGCKFHTRCPHATEICITKQPIITQVSETQSVFCHLY